MRRGWLAIAAAVGLILAVLPVGGVGAQEKIVIRWGHFAPPEQPLEKGAQFMAKNVKDRTNGRVEIRTFPANQLGSNPAMAEMVQAGSLEMMFLNGSYMGTLEPEWSIFDAPFVFENEDHVRCFVRGDLAKGMIERFREKRGIRVLDGSPIFGPRHLSTKGRPIRRPEDLKGLKIRVHEAKTRVDMIKAWGAEPVVTPTAEMYLAMQTGLADGQESPLSWQVDNRYWEVQKYVMMTGHFVQQESIVISDKFFQGLPKDVQPVLQEEAHKTADYITDLYKKRNEEAKQTLKQHGMTIVEDVDKAAFRKATETMWKQWENRWGVGMHYKVMNYKCG